MTGPMAGLWQAQQGSSSLHQTKAPAAAQRDAERMSTAAEEGIPSRPPPADNWSGALPRLSAAPHQPHGMGTGLGLPAARGASSQLEMVRGKSQFSHSQVYICKICSLFKNKSTAHAQHALNCSSTNSLLCMKVSPHLFSPQNHVHIFQKTLFFFCGVAVSQHLTSLGQTCQNSLGKRIKKISLLNQFDSKPNCPQQGREITQFSCKYLFSGHSKT